MTGAALSGSAGIFNEDGDSLALSPIFNGNLRARYEFAVRDFLPFFQIGGTYTGHSHSAVANFNNDYMEPYTIADASMGVSRGPPRAQIFCNNFTNERGQQFISSAQFVQSVIVSRPLTAGLKLSYTFR